MDAQLKAIGCEGRWWWCVQPVVSSALDFFFGKGKARVPPSTSFHDRLADLLLTSFSFAAEDPGAPFPATKCCGVSPALFLPSSNALNNAVLAQISFLYRAGAR